MSGHVLKVIPDDALFGGESEKATIPPQIQDLEQMAPEASAAVATSTPAKTVVKKGLPEWGDEYLRAIEECEGNLVAATEMIGKSFTTTYKAKRDYPALAQAIQGIKARFEDYFLNALEHISLQRAMDPTGNPTERIFQLNALDSPKYRPKPGGNQLTSIHITYGVSVPGPPNFSQAQEVPASITVEDSP